MRSIGTRRYHVMASSAHVIGRVYVVVIVAKNKYPIALQAKYVRSRLKKENKNIGPHT